MEKQEIAARQEELCHVTGMDFRYIGHYSFQKGFALTIYSHYLARELVDLLNAPLSDHLQFAYISEPEYYGNREGIAYTIQRWKVVLPYSTVTPEYIAALSADRFLRDELALFVNSLQERYYDVITSIANANACQRAYESDVQSLRKEQLNAHQLATELVR